MVRNLFLIENNKHIYLLGEIWDSVNHSWYKPNDLLPISKYVLLWKELGAYIIGGCCRTTPDDIYEIIKILK